MPTAPRECRFPGCGPRLVTGPVRGSCIGRLHRPMTGPRGFQYLISGRPACLFCFSSVLSVVPCQNVPEVSTSPQKRVTRGFRQLLEHVLHTRFTHGGILEFLPSYESQAKRSHSEATPKPLRIRSEVGLRLRRPRGLHYCRSLMTLISIGSWRITRPNIPTIERALNRGWPNS